MPISSADPLAFLAIGMQSALGTPQVTPAKLRFCKYLAGTDIAATLEIVDLREGGDGLDFGYTYKKSQKVAGQIVINARPEIVGQILQLLPGGATWSGASAPAVHNFHTGHASHPWSTFLAQHPGSTLAQMLSDVRLSGITIEGNGGIPVKLTLPFVGINHGASYAAITATNPIEEPFLFQHNPTYVIDGTGDTDVTAYKFTMGLGLEELQTQAVTLDEIVVQSRDTDVEFTRRYEAPTAWKNINMGGGVSPTTSVATGSFRADHLYGAAAALRSLSLQAQLISYRGLVLTELDPDGKTIYETFSAKALKGATHAFMAILNNAHASAYAP